MQTLKSTKRVLRAIFKFSKSKIDNKKIEFVTFRQLFSLESSLSSFFNYSVALKKPQKLKYKGLSSVSKEKTLFAFLFLQSQVFVFDSFFETMNPILVYWGSFPYTPLYYLRHTTRAHLNKYKCPTWALHFFKIKEIFISDNPVTSWEFDTRRVFALKTFTVWINWFGTGEIYKSIK